MGRFLRRSIQLLVLLLSLPIATPQARPAAQPRPGLRLEAVLREWSRANDAIRSIRYCFTLTEEDRAFGERKVQKGKAQVLKPNLLRVDIGMAEQRTVVLITREQIHCFDFGRKTERIWKRPEDRSFLGEITPRRSFWEELARIGESHQHWTYWLFAGLPVRDLTRRFDVRLTNEDSHYVYLEFQPRGKGNKAALTQ